MMVGFPPLGGTVRIIRGSGIRVLPATGVPRRRLTAHFSAAAVAVDSTAAPDTVHTDRLFGFLCGVDGVPSARGWPPVPDPARTRQCVA